MNLFHGNSNENLYLVPKAGESQFFNVNDKRKEAIGSLLKASGYRRLSGCGPGL